MGLYRVIWGYNIGFYEDTGKENGSCYKIRGYILGLYTGYIRVI